MRKIKLTRGLLNKLIPLVLLVGILLAFAIYCLVVAIKLNIGGPKVFSSESVVSGLELNEENVERINHKDFTDLDILFYASEYDDKDNKKVKFKLVLAKKEDGITPKKDSNNGYFYVNVALGAEKVDFESYLSTSSSTKLTSSYFDPSKTLANQTTKVFNPINCDVQFPAKKTQWPITVTAESPDAYLYIKYTYTQNAIDITKEYILKHTYDDYYITPEEAEELNITATQGGIVRQ
jgi:hypothetical protein